VIDWKGFVTAQADAGYSGGLSIENEDQFYYPSYAGTDFTEAFKEGFRVRRVPGSKNQSASNPVGALHHCSCRR
jgi:hypothetical protein